MERYRAARDASGGFTLVELLTTIVILGVLSGVVVMGVGGLREHADETACAAELRTLRSAEETHFAMHSTYADEDELVAAGLLDDESVTHDVEGSATGFVITPVGDCEGASSAADTTTTTAAPTTTTTIGPRHAGGGPAGVSVELIGSNGVGVAGGTVAYRQSFWVGMGNTDATGRTTRALAAGTYTFRIDFRGQTSTFGPVAVTSGSVVTFPMAATTVRLAGATGVLSAATIAHRGNGGYWVGSGNTDGTGTRTLDLLSGTYDFRASFRGQTNTQPGVIVSGARNVDFPLTAVTVNLTGGSGALGAASIAHRGNDGYWVGTGNTDATGTTSTFWLPGTYDVRASFRGQTNTRAAIVVAGSTTTVEFALTTLRVNLTGGAGTLGAASLAHRGNDGYWVGAGNTDGTGTGSVLVLPGTYAVRASFRGQTNTQAAVAVVAGAPTNVDFALTTLRVNLTGGAGTLGAASLAHRGNDGYWVGAGNTDGTGTGSVFVLPGTYDVRASFRGQTNTVTAAAVAGPTSTVNFPLAEVTFTATHSGSPASGVTLAHRGNDGYWVGSGTTGAGGSASTYLLPGTYSLRATRWPSTLTIDGQVVPGGPFAFSF